MSGQTKTALITGSTSGIGLGIATAFAAQGYSIILNGLGESDEIEAMRVGLAKAHGVKVIYHPANMTKPEEIADMMQQGETQFGGVDVLVNNAGVQFVSPIESFPVEKWDQIIAIDLSSAFHTIRLAIPMMVKRKWGRIINIASAHGLVASPFKSAYVAAKHGLVGLTKTVALEHAQENITCNAICPGYVLTGLVQAQIPDQAKSRGISEDEVIKNVLLAAQPTKQFVTVEQIAAFALYLASESAAQFNGAILSMDGGWTAQ
ncbi:3-hydroxybutyrate dehydrogenase [Candidatus Phycosocius spiralis]|uniref:3-hydroxybutyrate dehydrogenase n=1 Tax=Candidatus Phycosocius spiralis TaxID=2815099 RepID=A0ABQ4PX85_9PROT|nr:3-hydroxybutyrate dehydrogenase [Candidatus Phycosocius spiralis]GIU67652.1 3-hydroxybutyrate dehydrogenase [Candidatus Phycosocius spiralis]